MAELYYPQLKTGAVAHYPVRKLITGRTVANVLPGGDAIMYPDDGANRTIWSWEYHGITLGEASALQDFFNTCDGPLRPFTFLDPVGNLLSSSSDFRGTGWEFSKMATITGDVPGPIVDAQAVTIVNAGQAAQEVSQTLRIPGNYAYCFSIYVKSSASDPITLFRRSAASEQTVSFESSSDWTRISSSGNLGDATVGVSVGIRLLPGQQLSISAAQLEAQPNSSSYRSGQPAGDVYTDAHWAMEELSVRHVAPNDCIVSVSIEA